MALNDTIKTRVLLRNDTLARWGTSTLVLGKGEVAIATGLEGNLVEVRVGNNTTWANSAKLAINASQISGITNLIEGTAKKYQIVEDGSNKWKLQEAALSGGNWTDVSTLSVDFSDLTGKIDDLSGEVNYISGVVDSKLNASTFNVISTYIGLNRATETDQVVIKSDLAALDNVMHFKGVVDAIPSSTGEYEVGDVVLVVTSDPNSPDNGKEFVLVNVGTNESPHYKWEKIGDQNAISALTDYVNDQIDGLSNAVSTTYATKTDVNGISATLCAVSSDYLTSADKTEITGLIETSAAAAVAEANGYTDGKIAELSIDDYATKTYVDTISGELSTTAHNEITAVLGQAGDLSTANTVYGAKKYAEGYTDAAIADLSIDNYIKHGEVIQSDLSGFFVFDCGDSVIRDNEPTA